MWPINWSKPFDAPLGTSWGIFWEPNQNPIKHDGNTLGTRKIPPWPFQRKKFEPLINECQAFHCYMKILFPKLCHHFWQGHKLWDIMWLILINYDEQGKVCREDNEGHQRNFWHSQSRHNVIFSFGSPI